MCLRFVDVSWSSWNVRGNFVDPAELSMIRSWIWLNFRGYGGNFFDFLMDLVEFSSMFVDCSWIWLIFCRILLDLIEVSMIFMELDEFSLHFRGPGGIFVCSSWNGWNFHCFFVDSVDFS